VVLGVLLLDVNKRGIMTAGPVRDMTQEEMTTFLALQALPGETMSQFIARAAAPYIASAYGMRYSIPA
jgi:hypothetical protein